MTKFYKILLMMVSAATAFAACAPRTGVSTPEAPLEECVYMGGRTDFSVWSPKAEAAQLKLYRSAQDTAAFKVLDMKKSKGGL